MKRWAILIHYNMRSVVTITVKAKKWQQIANISSMIDYSLHIIDEAVDSIRCKQLQVEPQWIPIFSFLCAQPVDNTGLIQLCLILTTSITRHCQLVNTVAISDTCYHSVYWWNWQGGLRKPTAAPARRQSPIAVLTEPGVE